MTVDRRSRYRRVVLALTLLLVLLKLSGVTAALPWWAALTPLWLLPVVTFVVITACFMLVLLAAVVLEFIQ